MHALCPSTIAAFRRLVSMVDLEACCDGMAGFFPFSVNTSSIHKCYMFREKCMLVSQEISGMAFSHGWGVV